MVNVPKGIGYRKIGVILLFTGIGVILNIFNKFNPTISNFLLGLAGMYVVGNAASKFAGRNEK